MEHQNKALKAIGHELHLLRQEKSGNAQAESVLGG
jgi:hypothetical protein